ncbi:phosphoadenosine phosphosulfate sulfotransferase [Ureibacillus sp. NPDC094379]
MNVRKGKLLIIFFGILLLFACSTERKQLIFSGESDNWSVRYEVKIIDEDSETKGFIIKYTGNESIPKQLEYAIDSTSGSGTDLLDKKGVLKMAGSGCDGCAITREDQEIEAIIKWDDKSEIIPLVKE